VGEGSVLPSPSGRGVGGEGRTYTNSILIALLLASLLYAAVWFASRHKLIFTDEIVFAEDFARITQGNWRDSGIPHPPLYTTFGSLAVSAFGYNTVAFRVVGGLSYLLTLWLLPLACRTLSASGDVDSSHARASLIAIAIWAVMPLALQGSLLLDIDNTLFTPAALLFLIAWAHSSDLTGLGDSDRRPVRSSRTPWPLALAFALMLWTKLLPGTLFVTAAVLLISLLQKRLRVVLMALALGAALFAASLFAVASLTQFPLEIFFTTFRRVNAAASGTAKLISRGIMGGGITAMWIGLPFMALYLVAIAQRLRQLWRTRHIQNLDVLWLCSLPAYILLSIGNDLPMGFPRYHYPIVLLIVLFTSLWLAESQRTRTVRAGGRSATGFSGAVSNRLLSATAIIAAAAYFALVVPDPLYPQYQLTFATNNLSERIRFGLQSQVLGLLLPFGALLLVFWMAYRSAKPALLSTCLAFVAASWPVTLVAQATAPYATIYEYGRIGGRDISTWLQPRTQPTDVVVAPREIHFAAQRNGEFVIDLVGPTGSADKWLAYFAAKHPAAYVLTTKEDGRYTNVTREPRVLAVLDACYTNRIALGSYIAYARSVPICPVQQVQ
jgi:hypothetical protein